MLLVSSFIVCLFRSCLSILSFSLCFLFPRAWSPDAESRASLSAPFLMASLSIAHLCSYQLRQQHYLKPAKFAYTHFECYSDKRNDANFLSTSLTCVYQSNNSYNTRHVISPAY